MCAAQARVALLIGSGVIAAAQIGKAIVSVPLIRQDMATGLDHAGFLVAIFATLGACAGIGLGAVVTHLGLRRALIGGMSLIALGNLIGASATSEPMLFVTRLVEGIGFFGTVLAIPTMLARIAADEERDFVMALWSAYMPAGIMLMLAAGPLLELIGWRNFWLGNAMLAAACALALAAYAPAFASPSRRAPRDLLRQIVDVLRCRRCWLIASAFFAYSCQIFSLVFALPSLLTAQHGVSLADAGILSALALAASTIGHLVSGLSLRLGVPIWINLAVPFGFFACADLVIFAGHLPALAVAAVAGLALCVGGLAPGALYATAPRIAPNPQALAPTIGLVQQASNLGQFAGPVALGSWVAHFGWHSVPAIDTPAALAGLILAFAICISLAPMRNRAISVTHARAVVAVVTRPNGAAPS
jgi:predicted MFS family arabinose efflux permease